MDKNKKIDDEKYRFHIIHHCQGYWLGQDRNRGTVRLGGWNWHKGHIPTDILYNCDIPLLVELDDYGLNMTLFNKRDSTDDNRHVWILYHLYKYVNKAIGNYKLKYCKNWKQISC